MGGGQERIRALLDQRDRQLQAGLEVEYVRIACLCTDQTFMRIKTVCLYTDYNGLYAHMRIKFE